jgi:hypothetical protein
MSRMHLFLLLLAAACGKGELDAGTLTGNPFDPDYQGPAVFALDTTYVENVPFPGGTITRQVIAFDVLRNRFLSPASYAVRVADQENGTITVLDPEPAGTDHFRYHKSNVVMGTPVCLHLQLFNNQSAARTEAVCATLQ